MFYVATNKLRLHSKFHPKQIKSWREIPKQKETIETKNIKHCIHSFFVWEFLASC